MVIFSLVDPWILPGPPDSILWGVKFRYHCDNFFVKPLLDLKVYFIFDTMNSSE